MRKRLTVFGAILWVGLLGTTSHAGTLPILTSIDVSPQPASSTDFLLVDVSGDVPSTGYSFPDNAAVTVSGQEIFVDIFAIGPTDIVLPVVLPFTVSGEIGFLPAGQYVIIAELFVDGVSTSTLTESLEVVVPLPATAGLLASAIAGLMLGGRRRGNR